MGKKKRVKPNSKYRNDSDSLPNSLAKDFFPVATLPLERQPLITNPMYRCCGNDFLEPSPITAQVWLGDLKDANNLGKLQQLGITHIMNVTEKSPSFPDDFQYFSLSIHDQPNVKISNFFKEGAEWIKDAITKRQEDGQVGKVLIHCRAGVSRSVTMCAAYLMLIEGMQLHSAVEWMYHQRPVICPNEGFKLQLAKFEVELYMSSSVVLSGKPRWNFYELNRIKQEKKWKNIAMPPDYPVIKYPCCTLM